MFIMKLGERVKQKRLELGLTRPDLCKLTGMPHPSLVALEDRPQSSSKFINELANALNVSVEWLLAGITSTDRLIPQGSTVAVLDDGDHSTTHHQIPIYDIRLSAGNGNAVWVTREQKDDPLYFRKGWFKARHLKPDTLKGLYVRGDSMEPYLFHYDTVLIDIDDTEITDGEVYALIFKDKFYVKELQNIDGEVSIISRNDKYPQMKTQKGEESEYGNYFQVLGKVVWRGG
ncbi:MAG: helix-turn-helix transcriptional regulator [Gammaproteobacteria bacterium]|nr:helix-turn-helix transcriptional regulator [Gammaproteobacteria bacterium]